MRVGAYQNQLDLGIKLAKESDLLVRRFSNKDYSRIEDIGDLLLQRDISVEKKKNILARKLHSEIAKAFSINKKKFNRQTFESIKKRLHSIRKIVIKLRSINYYLETLFLDELKLSKIKIRDGSFKLKRQDTLAGDELQALEYTAYKLIAEAAMLDKRLLSEYANKEKKVVVKEKFGIKDLGSILKKESWLLEHLEAKLPPPKAANISLIKEPVFTHWVARVFALLSRFEHLYAKESIIFRKLKQNKVIRMKINRKIMQLIKESSKLLRIIEEKEVSMKKFKIDSSIKKELHNLTTTITL